MITDREHQFADRLAVAAAHRRATLPRRVRPIRNPLPARTPAGAVYVGRRAWGLPASPYANPHRVGKPCRVCGGGVRHTDVEAVALYRQYLRAHPELVEQARVDLAGRDLACWCPTPETDRPDMCHAAVLLAVVGGARP